MEALPLHHLAANHCAFQTPTTRPPTRFRLSTTSRPIPSRRRKPPAMIWQIRSTPLSSRSSLRSPMLKQQSGLVVSLSPDNGEGGRMSFIGLYDTPDGIEVIFYDTPQPDGEFAAYELTETPLPRDVPHTIKIWMKLNPGPNNDLVRISIDNHDAGQCFTTWENFYRASSQPVPTSDTLLFLSGGKEGDIPSLVGGGYRFDNVTVSTGNGPGPPGCDVPIEKKADTHTVRPGGRIGYRITARNRGPLAARNVLVCDHFPREMTFVSADRKLLRLRHRALPPDLAPRARPTRQLPPRAPARCERAAGHGVEHRRSESPAWNRRSRPPRRCWAFRAKPPPSRRLRRPRPR